MVSLVKTANHEDEMRYICKDRALTCDSNTCLDRLEAEYASRIEARQLLEPQLPSKDVARTVGVPPTSRFGKKMEMETLVAEKLDGREKDTAEEGKMKNQKVSNSMK
ncbi:hypothetical protein BELL_0547g00020 [Botrytis elliptica]|uniref:Uncharacterized protein n=1 Tax=Botrytis elliptica TaxID=278938 RepID=A0A4Z1JDI1_9HELO|nr:hypothetical protein BELL_0547g00020 [Botrytis elliptica]